ncbi:hypothetical protein FRC10_003731 [Ceratobasidium sp. 414]|nr:hypothetical protein FRC10_003731 [Ceratobasidium sp. 414]
MPKPSVSQQAITLFEVSDHICGFVDNGLGEVNQAMFKTYDKSRPTRRGDLASLSRTCRGFFHPAVRQLWGSIIDVRDLLSLLPGITVSGTEPGIPELCELNFMRVDLPDPLPPDYFDRFNIYARYVKFLLVRDVIWIGGEAKVRTPHIPRAMQALRVYAESHVLLPSLKFMSIQNSHYLAKVPDLIRGYWNWPEILLSPSLSALEIDGDYLPRDTLEDVDEIVAAAMHKCPELQHLELASGSRAPRGTMPLPPVFFDDQAPVLRKLRRLRCWNAPVRPEFIRWLQRMPNLAHVQLCYLKPAGKSLLPTIESPSQPTSPLKDLVLFSPEAEATMALWHTPFVHQLTRLSISFSSHNHWTSARILDFFKLLGRKSHALADLTLVLADRGISALSLTCFTPIKHLPIRSLTTIGGLGDHWRLEAMRDIALNWSSLRELHMQMYSCPLRHLAYMLPYCPDLITVHIDTLIPEADDCSDAPAKVEVLPSHAYQPLTLVSDFGFCQGYGQKQIESLAQYVYS